MHATHHLECGGHEISSTIHLEAAFFAMLEFADFAPVRIASGQRSP